MDGMRLPGDYWRSSCPLPGMSRYPVAPVPHAESAESCGVDRVQGLCLNRQRSVRELAANEAGFRREGLSGLEERGMEGHRNAKR